jgi:hypothetical protein
MPIPPLDDQGFLPEGVHDCALDETKSRFGSFQQSDRRPTLFGKLQKMIAEIQSTHIGRWLVIDGSFVTGKADPNDIDLILVVIASHDFTKEVNPAAYNVLSKKRVRRRFGFDMLVAREGSIESTTGRSFFNRFALNLAVVRA